MGGTGADTLGDAWRSSQHNCFGATYECTRPHLCLYAAVHPQDVICGGEPAPPPPPVPGEQATCLLKSYTSEQLAKTYGLCEDCYAACGNVDGCFFIVWKGVTGIYGKYPVVRRRWKGAGHGRERRRHPCRAEALLLNCNCSWFEAPHKGVPPSLCACTHRQTLQEVICKPVGPPDPVLQQATCVLKDSSGNELAEPTYGECPDCYAACYNVGCDFMTWKGVTGQPSKSTLEALCDLNPVRQSACTAHDINGNQVFKSYGSCSDCEWWRRGSAAHRPQQPQPTMPHPGEQQGCQCPLHVPG